MFDPISIFYIWLHTQNLAMGRLDVNEVIKMKENVVIVEQITNQITIRQGYYDNF